MKGHKTKQVSNVIKQIVDNETGEILDTTVEKHFTTKIDTDNFYMVFIENLAPFFGLKNSNDIKLISAMCSLAGFNTGIVKMTKQTRIDLCNETGIGLTNISRHLKTLVKAELLFEANGDYTINPLIFWKGNTSTRLEVLNSTGLEIKLKILSK